MNKITRFFAQFSVLCAMLICASAFNGIEKIPVKSVIFKDSVPKAAQILMKAYPKQIIGYSDNYIIWYDSTRMVLDDKIENKSFQTLLDSGDLEDQVMAMSYPISTVFKEPKKNQDPGRVRFEPFFLKMYGKNEEAVKKNLVEIEAFGQKFKATTINGIDKKIVAMWGELRQNPEWTQYLKNIGGIFTWRKISGTNRLSAHSFGMTIDINTEFSHYWQWDNKDWKTKGENIDLKYRNKIPLGIVSIFEKYGFIWGGKWYHYDTMHFEYRPELLVKSQN